MRVLLTGGTGFLGRRLAERLARDHELVLLVRPPAERPGLPAAARRAEGDVTDRAAVERAMTGCDAAVHAAALVRILAPAAEFDRVNLGGLETFLAAAETAGVGRLLYVSSFIALGPTERLPGGVADEGSEPLGPHGPGRRWINHYERTKTLADRRARRAIAEGAPLSVVYPGVVYGPGELTEGNILVRHLLDLAAGRLPGLIGRPDRRWSYVFVEDAAEALARTLEAAAPGSRYCAGGDTVSLGDFYGLVGELGGIRVPRRRIPDPVATAAGWLDRTWSRARGATPRLTPDLVEVYRHDWALSSERARAELGWAPRGLREGLGATLEWLRGRGEWPA